MHPKFPSLAKLPRAKRWTSVNYRFQTPGLLDPFFGGSKTHRIGELGGMLDPHHPAASLRFANFPKTSPKLEAFGGRVFPLALLIRGVDPFPPMSFLTWRERVEKAHQAGFSGVRINGRLVLFQGMDEHGNPRPYEGADQVYPKDDPNTLEIPGRNAHPRQPFLDFALRRAARRVPMSFNIATSKKRMGTLAFMRAKIVKRVRGVLDLVTSRGAYVMTDEAQQLKIRLDEGQAGRQWSMQGWAYVFYPTTELYQMPLLDLITLVRNTLQELNDKAIKMENAWLAESLFKYKPELLSARPSSSSSNLNSTAKDDDAENDFEDDLDDLANFITDPGSHEEDFALFRSLRRPLRTKPSSNPTGHKDHEAWETELRSGLNLLAEGPASRG